MNESIVKTSFNRFRQNMVSYISVGVLCALFLVLVATISFVDEFLFLVAIPVFALPFLFASYISCYLLQVNQPITIQAFGRYYVSFFRPQFRSSFRGIISFLKTLAVYFSLLVVAYIVMYFVFKNHYGATFTDAVDNLIRQYVAGLTNEELVEALKANDGILLTFIGFVSALPLPFAIASFLYLISFSSISLYYRANVSSGAPSMLRLGINYAYHFHRREMRVDWIKLNWSIVVLPILGGIGAGFICVFGIRNYSLLAPALTLGAMIPLIFILPFYFPNMEVIYQRYENAFRDGNKQAIETILERIQNSIELSEEEKRTLEESFRDEEGKNE